MKYFGVVSLISAALLLAPVATGRERHSTDPGGSGVSRAVAPAASKGMRTKTITGCLLNGSAAQEYFLLGPEGEQWTLRGDGHALGSHVYGFVKVVVLNSEDDGAPLSVVSTRSAHPWCSGFGGFGMPFLLVSARCQKMPC